MNIYNCRRSTLISLTKSSFQSWLSKPSILSITMRCPLETRKCFSVNHNKILCKGILSAPITDPKIIAALAEAKKSNHKDKKGRLWVYKGVHQRKLFQLKLLTWGGIVVGLGESYSICTSSDMFWGTKLGILFFTSLFAVLGPVFVSLLCKRYVTDILFEAKLNRYTAVTYAYLGQRKELAFTLEDIRKPKPSDTVTIEVEKSGVRHKLFFNKETFLHPTHYEKLTSVLKDDKTPKLTNGTEKSD